MSYYPKNTYHPNYYSQGVGKYTTEWVKKPDPPKPTYTTSSSSYYKPTTTYNYSKPPAPKPVAITPKPVPQTPQISKAEEKEIQELKDLRNMWGLGSDYPLSDVKKLVEFRKILNLGNGFPLGNIMYYIENIKFKKYIDDNRPANGQWSIEAVKKLFDNNTFSMNYYVSKTIYAEGIFPWWPMEESDMKVYRDCIKEELNNGKNVIKNIAKIYFNGKISEDLILKMLDGIITIHENKTIQDVINEWKVHKNNGTQPAILQ